MDRIWQPASRLVIVGLVLVALSPIVLLFGEALKPRAEFQLSPMGWPSYWTLQNLIDAWIQGDYLRAYANSACVALGTIVVVSVAASLAGYGLAQLDFGFKSAVILWLLVSMTVPVAMFLVPLFFAYQHVGLMNNLLGLVLIYSGIFVPFHVLLMRSYFVGLPTEWVASAEIDGANEFQTFLFIYLPLARPALLTVAVLVALWSWNEFYFANAFIQSLPTQTVSLKYLTFASSGYASDWSAVMAAGVVTIAPMILVYIALQRKFVEGLTEGGFKG